MSATPRPLISLTIAWILGLAVSGWTPFDRTTLVLEIFQFVVALPLMWATWKRLPLTTVLYWLITVHGVILMVGSAYTYAKVPLGFWMQDWFGFTRNHYDRIGHFAQGFVPAILARELLIRVWAIPSKKLIAFLSVCICLAFSALYELIEWWSALIVGQGANEFLDTQGDIWDTQADMFFALVGAITAVVLLRRVHDWQITIVNEFTSA